MLTLEYQKLELATAKTLQLVDEASSKAIKKYQSNDPKRM